MKRSSADRKIKDGLIAMWILFALNRFLRCRFLTTFMFNSKDNPELQYTKIKDEIVIAKIPVHEF